MSDRRNQNILPPEKTERRKSPRRRDLSRALGNYVLASEDERAERLRLEEENNALKKEIYTDSLTKLNNRRSFNEKFPVLVSIAHANNEPLAFLFFDANKLHDLNKSEGHQVGDFFLIDIAQRLKTATRDTDLVARLGGDEFGVVLTGYKPAAGVSEQELTDDTVARLKAIIGEDASFGIALLEPDESAEELYSRADALCTANKPAGSRLVERSVS